MDWRQLAFICIFIYIIQGSTSLRLVQFSVPSPVIRNQRVRLHCNFSLDNQTLYSVKWYRNGQEFYRFVPRDQPQTQVFPQKGVHVIVNNSNENVVILSSVQLASSGIYRCEVSGEAPSFLTVSEHAEMLVVALPEEGPTITGGRRRYQLGKTVHVNCTSKRSKPAATLRWKINGETVTNRKLLVPYEPIAVGREGLETTTLGLRFVVNHHHINQTGGGDMKLKCIATIENVYSRSNEESVQGEPSQKRVSVLESRGTAAPSGSRADRVQAAGGLKRFPPHVSLIAVCYFFLTLLSPAR